jgi:hypothetical protein
MVHRKSLKIWSRIHGVGPVPTRILSFTRADGELVPALLGNRDRPWLRRGRRQSKRMEQAFERDGWWSRCETGGLTGLTLESDRG